MPVRLFYLNASSYAKLPKLGAFIGKTGMSKENITSTDANNPNRSWWHTGMDALTGLGVGTKISVLMFVIGLAPPLAALLFLRQMSTQVQNALALYVAVFVIIFWPLLKIMEEVIVLRQTRRISSYVEEVKKGRRSPYFDLPEEKGDEHDFLRLQRNIFWMVQGLKTRESRLEEALHKLHHTQKQVQESLDYASLIQRAILPGQDRFKSIFSDYFLIWQPRDRVGGDAYWIKDHSDYVILAVYDCTGHGVPGAFLTIIAYSLFEQSYDQTCRQNPALLLTKMNAAMKKVLTQSKTGDDLNDGLEGVVCCLDRKTGTLHFSGAKSSIYLTNHRDVMEIKGGRHGVGFADLPPDQSYVNHRIDLNDVDGLYLFTDGIIDQAGGLKGLPFGRRRLRQWLLEHKDHPMVEQQRSLERIFRDYKGRNKQRDDVTFLGISKKGFLC